MGNEQQIVTDEQISRIVAAVSRSGDHPHQCRFDDAEAKSIHALADSLANGGMDNFREVLEFGALLRQARKARTAAIVVSLVAAFFTILGLGIREWFRRN